MLKLTHDGYHFRQLFILSTSMVKEGGYLLMGVIARMVI